MKHLSRLFKGFCYVGTILIMILAMLSFIIMLSKYAWIAIVVMFAAIMYLVGWELEVTFKKDDSNE